MWLPMGWYTMNLPSRSHLLRSLRPRLPVFFSPTKYKYKQLPYLYLFWQHKYPFFADGERKVQFLNKKDVRPALRGLATACYTGRSMWFPHRLSRLFWRQEYSG